MSMHKAGSDAGSPNAQRTPGPWLLGAWHSPDVSTKDGKRVAMVYNQADRKLIAAAPDLLTALENIVSDWDALEKRNYQKQAGGNFEPTRITVARNAIKKALITVDEAV